ncbi:MAG: hypothetical protein RLY93_15510 [Sumerlaeia bacterium]
MAESRSTTLELILTRVETWQGIAIEREDHGQVVILCKGEPLARTIGEEALQIAFRGPLREKMSQVQQSFAGPVRMEENNAAVVSLTGPRAVEEPIRLLLNAYMMAQKTDAREWSLDRDPAEAPAARGAQAPESAHHAFSSLAPKHEHETRSHARPQKPQPNNSYAK